MATSGDDTTTPSTRSKILADAEQNERAWDRWSTEDEQQLLDLVVQGLDWKQIAKQLGRTAGAVQTRTRRLAFAREFGREIPDSPKRDKQPRWTHDDEVKLLELVATADSWDTIGAALGRAGSACRRKAETIALDRLREGDPPHSDGASRT